MCYYKYTSERQPQWGVSGGALKRNAENYHHEDIALSRFAPELVLSESAVGAEKVAEQLVREVDEFLFSEEVRSETERDHLLHKLDTAIAINNHPKAKSMRAELLEKFGDDKKRAKKSAR